MHDRQAIRNAVANRLRSQVGSLVPGGIHAGRAAGIVADGELAAIFVDVMRSKGELFSEQASSLLRSYFVHVIIVGDGPEPDLADPGEPSCCDALDDLAVAVEAALKRNDVLGGQPVLGFRPAEFGFVDDALAAVPGGKGAVAHLTLRFILSLVQEDGAPVRS